MRRLLLALLLLVVSTTTALADKTAAFLGQSLCTNLFTDNSVYVAPSAGTYMWDVGTNSWVTVQGAGAREYANMLHAQTGETIRLYPACVGGSALLAANANPATPTQYWLSSATDAPRTALFNMVAAAGVIPDWVEWNQGQQDYTSTLPDVYNDYRTGLNTFYTSLLTQWGKTTSQLPFTVWVSGKASYGNSQYVMGAQVSAASSFAGMRQGSAYYDLTYTDGTHVNAASSIIMGDRGARVALKYLGFAGKGAGPKITTLWRNGSVLILNVALDGGTMLQPKNPWGIGYINSVAGFYVWDTSWNPVPINGVQIMGNRIQIQMAYPTGACVTYQHNSTQEAGWSVYDDDDLFIPGYGQPLIPMPIAICG